MSTEQTKEQEGLRSGSIRPVNGSAHAEVAEKAVIDDTTDQMKAIYSRPQPAGQREMRDPLAVRRAIAGVKPSEGDIIASAGVKFKGEITSCKTLMVEGEINAQVQAQNIIVANGGQFVGKADVGEADISGRFEGTLRSSGKLIIRRSGRVNGSISYGQLEIEPGGELRGTIEVSLVNSQRDTIGRSSVGKSWWTKR
jgi:cytoskeletal protein CcmA (bactofilin family)